MHSFNLVCLAAFAAVAFANDITCINKDVFGQSSNPNFKLLPKDFSELGARLSPDSPLFLFVRSAQGVHDSSDRFKNMYHRLKGSVQNATIGDVTNDDRFYYFDPELDDAGNKQAQMLQDQLKASGWSPFLAQIDAVQYISSPLTRSIQTALQAIPDCKIIVDEGVRPRITPLGIDLRRNYNSPLIIGDETLESVQTKFKAFKSRLIFQMANCDSEKIYDKFGYLSDEDPNVKKARMESDQELNDRIGKWFDMLRRRQENKSKATQVMDKIIPDPIQKKLNQLPPKVYVVFANQSFISAIIHRFNLDAYQKGTLNFCEVVPLLLQFGSGTAHA